MKKTWKFSRFLTQMSSPSMMMKIIIIKIKVAIIINLRMMMGIPACSLWNF